MYKLHLILKYLRKRRIAWVSLIAVTLCTALVIVVISVMGGWLRMFKEQFHGLGGDIIVHGESQVGFPYYQEMIDRIEKLPEVNAAVPTIETFGLVNVRNLMRRGVRVVGYPTDKLSQVNDFPKSLYHQYQELIDKANDPNTPPQEKKALLEQAENNAQHPNFDKPFTPKEYQEMYPNLKGDIGKWPGMIVGTGVAGIFKDKTGKVKRVPGPYNAWAKLTVVAILPNETSVDIASNKGEMNFWIVDDSHTKVWQVDQETVYVPFADLQNLLQMKESTETDQASGKSEIVPARTSNIQIGVKPGADLLVVKKKIQDIVDQVSDEKNIDIQFPIYVETWQEVNAVYIDAVEHEKSLVTFLFGLISIVAVFLIFCIFYMIVVEKTKDIGIIKSVGATSGGVAFIFLGYGLAIGIVGSGLGLLIGYGIVHNINFLHTEMGQLMGIQIWNPEVYAFDIIPDTMNPHEVAVIMVVAVLSSVLGSLVPAIRAADLAPVEALRWE